MPSACSCPYSWAAACSLTAEVTSSSTAKEGRLWVGCQKGVGWRQGEAQVGHWCAPPAKGQPGWCISMCTLALPSHELPRLLATVRLSPPASTADVPRTCEAPGQW